MKLNFCGDEEAGEVVKVTCGEAASNIDILDAI